MGKLKNFVKTWIVAPGLLELYSKIFSSEPRRILLRVQKEILPVNACYKDAQKGKRCFIVCNGPSISSQNLLSLRGEVVFSVSSGYHHKDYLNYKPLYHCTPQLTYSEKFTKEIAISWFREMHEKTGDAELFFGYQEEELIRKNNLFPGRKISYLCMEGALDESTESLDITKVVPRVSSVPIMCLILAIYMGFEEIYLLGVDHDSIVSREYKYFFKQTILHGLRGGVTEDDKISGPLCEEFYVHYRLFSQYRAIKKIANLRGINIYNATAGGILDEFERVTLDDLWKN